jgi:hypothetical protein
VSSERRSSQWLTIDELLNLVLAKLHSRKGRRILLVIGVLAVAAIALLPGALRSHPAQASGNPPPVASAINATAAPSAPVGIAASIPKVSNNDVADAQRIGPPLKPPTTTTTQPPARTTIAAPPPASTPAAATSPASSPSPPSPPPPPPSTAAPDTGIAVP